MISGKRRLRILTWQVHGNYLYYLSQIPHDFYLVTRPGHPPGYAGRTRSFPWGDNVHEIAPDAVRDASFDCVIFQCREHWERDRMELLSQRQRRLLPALYLEHDPPQQHPTDTRHWAQDASLLVHVTPFNALMWDSGNARTKVIEHGVLVPDDARYSGERSAGISAINHLYQRGRRLGADVYTQLRRHVPLHVVGMEAERMPGGIGEIANVELPGYMARYRFFFNPIRWTSLGLSVIEAMTVGMPIVGLATTELSSVIVNGRNGWIETDPDKLVPVMQMLLRSPDTARLWGMGARATALQRFGISRFTADWDATLCALVSERETAVRAVGRPAEEIAS
jgi:hypothetical protein